MTDPDSGGSVARHAPRRADIQGLRAVAVVLVVLFHAHLGFSGGFVGVDVFFVISGFVITSMLLPELIASGGLRLGTFYLRRIRRLVPALALLVVVVGIVGVVAAPIGIQPIAARTGAAASVFLGNVYLYLVPKGYFAASSDLNPFLHTWSLAVEEQFYLVFPLLLLSSWKLSRSRRHGPRVAVAVLAVVGLASFALAFAMVRGHAVIPGIGSPQTFAFYSSLTRAWEFAAGALLAFGAVRLRTVAKPIAMAIALVGFALILFVSLRYDAQTSFPGAAALPPVLGTVMILGAGVATSGGIGRLLSIRPAVFIGDLSYSWYLWHWPLIVFARAAWPGSFTAPVAAAVSLIPAWLSYRFVENPIRFNEALTGSRTVKLGIVLIAGALVACGVLVGGNRLIQRTNGWHSVQRAIQGHKACPPKGRLGRAITDPQVAVRCTWPVPAAQGTIALVGDSNAGHLIEPVVAAGRARHRAVYLATSDGCPFVDLTIRVLGERRDDCRRFFEGTVRAITALHPDVVVIGSSTTRYLGEEQFELVVGTRGPVATSPSAKAAAWEAGMRLVVMRLHRLHIATLVVHPVPKYPGWDLRGCAAGRVVLAEFTCGRSTSRESAIRSGAASVDAERAAIRGIPDARSVSFLPDLCSPTRCATSRGETWLYHDGDHLSVVGSRLLTPHVLGLFDSILASGR